MASNSTHKSNGRRMAFAVYADGERFAAYKQHLKASLSRHLPDIDVVDIDLRQTGDMLSIVPEKDRAWYVRLAIPLMDCFKGYDKVAWLDVDTEVVSPEFAKIFNAETSVDGLSAVQDIEQKDRISYVKSLYPDYARDTYFNSGVMVFDLGKINRNNWRRRVSEGLSRRMELDKQSIYHDQDVLNVWFDIASLDKRFNCLWRDADLVKSAYLVHYADKNGKKMLEKRILDGKCLWKERCIVVSPRHAFIRPWIRAYFASGNTIPLVIVPGPPGDWQPGDMEYCQLAADYCGGMVFDCADGWANARTIAHRAAKPKRGAPVGWYAKKNILHAVATKLSPKTWAWIDDDAELVGDVSECFDFAEKAPGFIYTQFYYPDVADKQHPVKMHTWKISSGEKLCWNSLVVFHGEANRRLEVLSRDFPVEDDEIIFGYLYRNDETWHDGFCDFSEHDWQKTCKRLSDIPKGPAGHLKQLHYTGNENNGECKRFWADKSDTLPIAPFEPPEVTIAQGEPVDAVFVIGTESMEGNEELRYALRSLDRNCKFIRDVYICGLCPYWVDKTRVRHLQWPDRFDHAKDANIIDKLRHACETKGIAKRILFCSDDQFQTKECTWDDFAPRWLRAYDPADTFYTDSHRTWHKRLKDTLEREVKRRKSIGMSGNNVFYYQPHMWMQIDRDLFLDYAKWSDYAKRTDTIIASGYFNFINANGRRDYDHIFLSGTESQLPKVRHIAYHDGSFRTAMGFLQELFPAKSRFEVDAGQPRSTRHGDDFGGGKKDPLPTTQEERTRIIDVMSAIRKNPEWSDLLGEVSRAEELRMLGVYGWRVVWSDLISRWERDTNHGLWNKPVSSVRSPDATKVVEAYISGPRRTLR